LVNFFIMPFTQNFAASQVISTPNLLILDDTSTGSDAAITTRRVYMQKSDGTYLVESGSVSNGGISLSYWYELR